MKHTWIEFDCGVLQRNIEHLRCSLSAGTEIIFVVKADAYGHGLLPAAECAAARGLRWLAVVHMDEAVRLRSRLPDIEILVLGVIWPEDVAAALEMNLVPLIVSERHADALAAEAGRCGGRLRCHAKIDTGMGRIGLPWEGAATALLRLTRNPALDIGGMCTHFAFADGSGQAFTREQAERFRSVTTSCEAGGLHIGFRHMSHSGLLPREEWHLDAVRTGIALYGYGQPDMRPCLQWRTRVVQVKRVPAGFNVGYAGAYETTRETEIATLDVGYADGYPRLLSNRGHVLIRGRRHPVAGRVTMNMIMCDVGPDSGITEGDVATLIGADGDAAVWADEIAKRCRTIPYEILTSIRTEDRRLTSAALPDDRTA